MERVATEWFHVGHLSLSFSFSLSLYIYIYSLSLYIYIYVCFSLLSRFSSWAGQTPSYFYVDKALFQVSQQSNYLS